MPTKYISLAVVAALAFFSAAFMSSSALAQKSMLCKLQSDKVVQGKERHCLYRCSDGTLEGRIRRVNQECLKTVYSAE
jgi:hypothetical protein